MQNPSVLWSEGMFLRPHHFQASDRYLAELTGLHSQIDHPYGYGVYRISVSEEAIGNGILELVGLKARLRDGTVVSGEANDVRSIDLNIRLTDEATGNKPITVFLALPHASEGRANVSMDAQDGLARYSAFRREIDEQGTGGNRQEIGLMRLNARIMFTSEDTTGFEIVPIMRLLRTGSEGAKFRVDPNYFPPSITTQSWSELATLIRDLRNFLGSRIKTLSVLIQDRGITLSSQVHGDLEKILLMQMLSL